MKLLLTTNARLYKTPDGKYWTPVAYGYEFFERYLSVFEEIRLVAHTKACTATNAVNMLRVEGAGMSIHEVPFPHGKMQYIKMYNSIRRAVKQSVGDCDAAILRIPDQLAFQIYPYLEKNHIPVGVEVTSDSWDFFAPGTAKSLARPFLRVLWHIQQKRICSRALGTAYVTQFALQKRYPPQRALRADGFTTHYTDTNIHEEYFCAPRHYSEDKEKYTVIHVAGNIGGHAKGHKELIEAVGMLKKKDVIINLVLVGAGTLSVDVLGLMDRYNLKDSVRFTGLLSNPEALRNELKDADVFVFPSYREGLPRVVVEAMACALPCVATALPGIKELLEANCLVPVKDSVALMNKMQELISDPQQLSVISRRNVKKAKDFSLVNAEKKRRAFYRKIKNSVHSNVGSK